MKWGLVLMLVCATTVGDVFRSTGNAPARCDSRFPPGRNRKRIRRGGPQFLRHHFDLRDGDIVFSFMKLVSIAPMSFAVPMSAATFIPETLLAKVVLKEAVDWRRWAGVGLILAGVVFISQ